MKKIIITALIIFLSHTTDCYALVTSTHEEINELVAISHITNEFTLDNYLIDQLNMLGGVEEEIDSLMVFRWIGMGGLKEDRPEWYLPFVRSANHFHNPITDEGYSGIWGAGIFDGESALRWAQLPVETQSPGGHYSWHDVRGYYEKALTSYDRNDREEFFAETFRGLGQLMHLVQDMSVPEHARDDGHYLRAYESWVSDDSSENVIINSESGTIEIKDIYNPITNEINQGYELIQIAPSDSFDQAELEKPSSFTDAPVPIANLFDTNTFIGSNPEVTVLPNIGLSEYTCANFVSGDTIFSNGFDYPSKDDSVTLRDVDIPDPWYPGSTVKRAYYIKDADVENGYLLVGDDYLRLYRENVMPGEPEDYVILRPMDRYVFAGYAKKLLPKAIGYSSSLLEYFFRGKIDMIPDPDGGDGYVIRNMGNEDMVGTLSLYYDDEDGVRRLVSWAYWNGEAQIPAGGTSEVVDFNEPDNPPDEYMLVFRGIKAKGEPGRMGNEEGAVVGKLVRLGMQSFFFKITRDDGTLVTSDWLTFRSSFTLYNSNGEIVNTNKTYDSVTGYWNITIIDTPLVIDPDGYWFLVSCNDSVETQYPYVYKVSERFKTVDLTAPGTYEMTIPYFKLSGSALPTSLGTYDCAKGVGGLPFTDTPGWTDLGGSLMSVDLGQGERIEIANVAVESSIPYTINYWSENLGNPPALGSYSYNYYPLGYKSAEHFPGTDDVCDIYPHVYRDPTGTCQ